MVKQNKVVRSSHEVIESKILTALNDEGKVAILLTEKELDDLICILECCAPQACSVSGDFLQGLKELRTVAF